MTLMLRVDTDDIVIVENVTFRPDLFSFLRSIVDELDQPVKMSLDLIQYAVYEINLGVAHSLSRSSMLSGVGSAKSISSSLNS